MGSRPFGRPGGGADPLVRGALGSDPDEKGKVLLDATCSLAAFQRAIASGARAVLDEWGEAGYRAKWIDHDFPTATLLELEGAL